jgi:hypothetical protein
MTAVGRRRLTDDAVELVRTFTRRWGRGTARRLSPGFQAHARAAVREGILALASLCEDVLRRAEVTTQRARRRVERIPVTAAPARARRRRPRAAS